MRRTLLRVIIELSTSECHMTFTINFYDYAMLTLQKLIGINRFSNGIYPQRRFIYPNSIVVECHHLNKKG